jgi:hypothetical protein
LIEEGDIVKEINYPETLPGERHHVDHTPSPAVIMRYVKENNLTIDELAWELILGRWCNDSVLAYGIFRF